MSGAMQDIARLYERNYPGSKVKVNIAGSGAMVDALAAGVRYDVLTTADLETMDRAEAMGLVISDSRRNIARNVLVVAVPKSSPVRIKSLNDLADPRFKRIVVGNPAVISVGKYARHALKQAGILEIVNLKALGSTSENQSLELVEKGGADAAFVYETSVRRRQQALRSAYYVKMDMEIRYPVAICKASREKTESQRFIAYLQGSQARRIFRYYGFQGD